MTKLLNKKDAANLLGVSVRTIDNLRKQGLPYFLIGGQCRFDENQIYAWVQAQQLQTKITPPAISANTEGGNSDGKTE